MRPFGLALLSLLLTPLLYAQSASADWKTTETAHFRVHFPREYEEWAMRAATRLESVREAVTREVGFAPEQKIDVIVMNPIAQANGIAWPLLDAPRIILYTDAPSPDEEIGAYAHWIDLVTVHETTHIVHMLRPSRNSFERAIERALLPLNPITLHAPRWVLEGYATVVEGRLTGAGRPNSTMRAAILRKWAQSGRLPSYAQLDSDRRFLGMSMAYLAGSAYLEWLEARTGEGSLKKLWARMTARHRRTFAQAFEGVFGDSPQTLYGRFTAELTDSALAVERAGELREGMLWQETTRASGDPAVSPDGTQLAMVMRPRSAPQRLVVFSTAYPEEEEKKHREQVLKILKADPEDFPPVRNKPLPRKGEHSLVMPDGGDITSPRWLRGGGAILFTHRMPDADGFLHRDLFVWKPDTDELHRVTHLADVGDADPFPEDRRAVAVRKRFGKTQLVDVDLETGAVTPRTEESIDVVWSHPRVSPNGAHLVHVAHRDGKWRLYVDQNDIGVTDASSPEWLRDDTLIATISSKGFAELHRITLDGRTMQVTRSSGGAFEPAPWRNDDVFFMGLEPDGFVVRLIDSNTSVPPSSELARSAVPALPPEPPVVAPFVEGSVSTPRPYGIGRQEWSWFNGENYAAHYRAFEAGLRLGDVVGRLDATLIASVGSGDAPDGVALAAAWRGWPVEIGAHVSNEGSEVSAEWRFRSAVAIAAAFGSESGGFATALLNKHQQMRKTRFNESLRVTVTDDVRRVRASFGTSMFELSAEAGDGDITLGGLASSIVPRSAYATRVLDPALPFGTLTGDDYLGWRIETKIPVGRAFYQRHELGDARVSLAGIEFELDLAANGILKTPGLHLTAGAARVFDPDRNQFWLGMRWRP